MSQLIESNHAINKNVTIICAQNVSLHQVEASVRIRYIDQAPVYSRPQMEAQQNIMQSKCIKHLTLLL